MIIGNANNISTNNFRLINHSKIKFIFKKLFFFSFIFIIISLFTYKLYISNNSIIHMKMQKGLYNRATFLEDDSINFKRDLDFINYNKNYSIEDNLKERMNKAFSFILNLTSNEYLGNWTDLSLNDKNFFDKNIENGIAELYFHKIRTNYYAILAKPKSNSFKVEVNIREGNYADRFIKINFTFYLDNNIDKYLEDDETFILKSNDMVADFYKIDFLINKKRKQ